MIDSRVNEPEEGIDYAQRVGSYAIIRNDDNHLAVIKTSTGYFLLGGGIKEGEDYKTCLKRECIEETGHEIEIMSKIGMISYFFPQH